MNPIYSLVPLPLCPFTPSSCLPLLSPPCYSFPLLLPPHAQVVDCFDFDAATGDVANRRTVVKFEDVPGEGRDKHTPKVLSGTPLYTTVHYCLAVHLLSRCNSAAMCGHRLGRRQEGCSL